MRSASTGEGALDTYRVLDLTDESGTYCTRALADLGADVVRVEPPAGDCARTHPPFRGDTPHAEQSLHFLHFNLNKRSVTLNLEHADGRALFRDLVRHADALVTTLSARDMERLEMTYEQLSQVNPGLVMTSITPFGLSGPRRDWLGPDLVISAIAGPANMTGDPERAPLRLGGEQSYHIGSLYAAVGTMLALYARPFIGRGQLVEITLQEAFPSIQVEAGRLQSYPLTGINPGREGNQRKVGFPYGTFPCRDGYVSIGCVEEHHWDALARWIAEVTGEREVRDPMYRGRYYLRAPYIDILEPFLLRLLGRFTREELFREGQRREVPLFPVATVAETVANPQLAQRGYFVQAEHPVLGRVTHPGGPYRLQATPWRLRRTAPLSGEHNAEVYCGELGLTREQLCILRGAGVV
ncbi:MAG: CoA transferase [Chloroflexi bacterium]|nr:CoA transferase [Chloroflexota bacterium]